MRVGFQRGYNTEAVRPRHKDIEQDQVGRDAPERFIETGSSLNREKLVMLLEIDFQRQ